MILHCLSKLVLTVYHFMFLFNVFLGSGFASEIFYLGGAPSSSVPMETSGGVSVQGCLYDFSFTTNTSLPRELVDPATSSSERR